MRFSILIPTTGRADLVRTAVRSILEQTYAERVEIVITDTAEEDTVSDMLRREFPEARIIYVKTPKGDPSLGWDFAYKQSSGDYMLWLDDDNYLFPWALEVFEHIVRKTSAQYITGHHVYYYDVCHSIPSLHNNLKIENTTLFNGELYTLNPQHLARSFLHHSLPEPERRFKLHPAVTVVSRAILEKIQNELGFVVVPYMRCNHSGNFLNVLFADTAVGISFPLGIVGRLGSSFTQTDKRTGNKNAWYAPFLFQRSPFHGNVFLNHVLESVLSAQAVVVSRPNIPLNPQRFVSFYAAHLTSAPHSVRVMHEEWRELREYIEERCADIPEQTQRYIRSLCRLALLLQPIKSAGLWPYLRHHFFIKKSLMRTVRYTFFRNVERLFGAFSSTPYANGNHRNIRLRKYGIFSIEGAAQNFARIYRAETGVTLKVWL